MDMQGSKKICLHSKYFMIYNSILSSISGILTLLTLMILQSTPLGHQSNYHPAYKETNFYDNL
jgi:hypothetical protein